MTMAILVESPCRSILTNYFLFFSYNLQRDFSAYAFTGASMQLDEPWKNVYNDPGHPETEELIFLTEEEVTDCHRLSPSEQLILIYYILNPSSRVGLINANKCGISYDLLMFKLVVSYWLLF